MPEPKEILEAALALGPTERARLAKELLDSLEQPVTVEPELAADIERRIREIESGDEVSWLEPGQFWAQDLACPKLECAHDVYTMTVAVPVTRCGELNTRAARVGTSIKPFNPATIWEVPCFEEAYAGELTITCDQRVVNCFIGWESVCHDNNGGSWQREDVLASATYLRSYSAPCGGL
jgi:hypothetical protein